MYNSIQYVKRTNIRRNFIMECPIIAHIVFLLRRIKYLLLINKFYMEAIKIAEPITLI